MNLRVVDGRIVASACISDLVACLAKQLGRRLLKTARGNAEPEYVIVHRLYTCLRIKNTFTYRLHSVALDAAEETTAVAFVAGGTADLVHFQQR